MTTPRKFSSRWFRFYDEVVDDPKVQTLSDKQFRFWVNVMCMASQNSGLLPDVPHISWKLRQSESVVTALIAQLYEKKLLDQEATTFSPHNWGFRQYISDVSTQRVRDHRKRQRNVSCNGEETDDGTKDPLHETPPDTDTEADTETEQKDQKQRAPEVALVIAPAANGSVVRPAAPPRRSGKRSTEEITKALGAERLGWWEKFWEIYPCHDGMNPAMDAFERKAVDREITQSIMNGAKRYRDMCATALTRDPSAKMKYGQGWLNDERWRDETVAPKPMYPRLIL